MRKLFLLLAIAFLFQSCFTYRVADMSPDKMTIGKTYKIQRNNKYQKVIVKSINDSTAVVSKRGEEENIPLAEITKVKSRKFSIVKTIVLPMTVVAAVTGLMILSYDGPTLGTIGWSKL